MSKIYPKISIVLPVLNSVETMEKALLSVFNQHYEPIELIILDAGSTDGTVDIIKHYQDRIAYWHSKPDGSTGLAINMGLKLATGELVGQLMADDWFEPGTFKAIAEAYLANQAVDMVSCGGRFVYFDDYHQAYCTKLSYETPAQLSMTLKNMCYGIPAMSSRFITKAYINRIGYLDALDEQGKHNYSADREYLIRAALLGCRNVIVNHLGHSYFIHQKSATFGNNYGNQIKIFHEHLNLIKKYECQYPEAMKKRSFFQQWYAHQSVRLCISLLMMGEGKQAFTAMKDGWQKTGPRWLLSLIALPIQRIYKKLVPFLRSFLLACPYKKECSTKT